MRMGSFTSPSKKSNSRRTYSLRWFLLWIFLSALGLYWFFMRSESPESVSLKEILSVSMEAARRGGAEVKAIRDGKGGLGERSKGKTQEGANNPVTLGDMASHRAMYYGILKAFPHIHIVSEEHDPQHVDLANVAPSPKRDDELDRLVPNDVIVPSEDVTIWIDPLDATQEYTENLTEYVTTMVCVAIKGKPVIGVIYKPFQNKLFWGWAGGINVANDAVKRGLHDGNSRRDKNENHFIVSRSHAGEVRDAAEKAFGKDIKISPAGGAGFKVLEVINGNQGAYIHVTLIKKWDICPGNAILEALGGNLTKISGYPIDYADGEVKNEGGVLAALENHKAYVYKLKKLLK